jgi:hypothetical protein
MGGGGGLILTHTKKNDENKATSGTSSITLCHVTEYQFEASKGSNLFFSAKVSKNSRLLLSSFQNWEAL